MVIILTFIITMIKVVIQIIPPIKIQYDPKKKKKNGVNHDTIQNQNQGSLNINRTIINTMQHDFKQLI